MRGLGVLLVLVVSYVFGYLRGRELISVGSAQIGMFLVGIVVVWIIMSDIERFVSGKRRD